MAMKKDERRYVEQRFDAIDKQFEKIKHDQADIRSTILQIAKEIGVKLSVEI